MRTSLPATLHTQLFLNGHRSTLLQTLHLVLPLLVPLLVRTASTTPLVALLPQETASPLHLPAKREIILLTALNALVIVMKAGSEKPRTPDMPGGSTDSTETTQGITKTLTAEKDGRPELQKNKFGALPELVRRPQQAPHLHRKQTAGL